MGSTELAYINPDIIAWAIKRSGKTRKQLEKTLGTTAEQISRWEYGFSYPSFSKAVKLAETLRIPFGYLYLDEPPVIEVPLPDFRKLTDAETPPPSIDLLDVLHSAMIQQDWYKDYELEHNAKPLPFVSSFTHTNSVVEIAGNISKILELHRVRKERNSWSEYLTGLTRSAEAAGILVMRSGVVGNNTRRPLSRDEFQGFAITDPIAPLVFINTTDYEAAKIFTLLHELAHIWTGQSGISFADEEQASRPTLNVESFCNAIAAEALVPRDEFLALWNGQINVERIQRLARHFYVSSLVILRRARELERISVSEFIKLLKIVRLQMTAKKQGVGGNYHANVEARHGSRFFEAVINDVRLGRTMYREASKLLNVSVPVLEKYVEGK